MIDNYTSIQSKQGNRNKDQLYCNILYVVLVFAVVTFPPESNDDVHLLFLRGLPLLGSSPCMASIVAVEKVTCFWEHALVGDVVSIKIHVGFLLWSADRVCRMLTNCFILLFSNVLLLLFFFVEGLTFECD